MHATVAHGHVRTTQYVPTANVLKVVLVGMVNDRRPRPPTNPLLRPAISVIIHRGAIAVTGMVALTSPPGSNIKFPISRPTRRYPVVQNRPERLPTLGIRTQKILFGLYHRYPHASGRKL